MPAYLRASVGLNLSTEGGESTVMEAPELGAAGFILKPLTIDQIRDKLRQFC